MLSEIPVPELDVALRGGGVVLLLLVASLLLRDFSGSWAARLGALFAVGAAAFAVSSGPGFGAGGSAWRVALLAFSEGDNVIFWLFALALFNDDFRPRVWQAAIWATVVLATLVCGLALQPLHSPFAALLDAGLGTAAFCFAGLAVVQTVSSWSADLVEGRRRLRVVVVGVSAGFILVHALANLVGLRGAAPEAFSLAAATGLAAIAAGVAWSFLGVAGGETLFASPGRASAAGPPMPRPADLSAADRRLLASVEQAMRTDRVYRQDGLTIGELALKQGVKEHRLRRLINQGLGYRNFNSFLNSYRIAEVRACLADPGQAAVPILTIALDAGFSSLGPFNRTFRQVTGTTPTAYRRWALERPAPEPTIAVSASRISKSA
jgi:AraC-like DNA-binding protein